MTGPFDGPSEWAPTPKPLSQMLDHEVDGLDAATARLVLDGVSRDLTSSALFRSRPVAEDGSPLDPVGWVAEVGMTGLLPDNPPQRGDCMFCPTQFFARQGFISHLKHHHPTTWAALMTWAALSKEDRMQVDTIRSRASNKSFIAQMQLWGWSIARRYGDRIRMTPPERCLLDISYVDVMPPGTGQRGNPGSVMTVVYNATGVSATEFWAGPSSTEPATPASPDPEQEPIDMTNIVGLSNRCLVLLLAQDRPMATEEVAELTGLSNKQAGGALAYLVRLNQAERIKNGMFIAVASHSDRHGYDIHATTSVAEAAPAPRLTAVVPQPDPAAAMATAHTAPPQPPPAPRTDRAAPAITEEEILALVEMAIPGGQVKVSHFRLLANVMDAIQALVDAVYADQ